MNGRLTVLSQNGRSSTDARTNKIGKFNYH